MEKFIACLSVFLIILTVGINGDVQFQFNSRHCLGLSVEYQCIVSSSSFMNWIVLDNELEKAFELTFSINGGSSIPPSTGEFTFTRSPVVPSVIISNISFTVQPSIIGYTIICRDLSNGVSESLIIQIIEPTVPQGVVVHNDSFTDSSVRVSWAESLFTQSSCFMEYHVNVSSTTKNIIMESTSNSVIVEGLVPSDDQYCIVVTAIDINNNSSNGSDPVCFIFNVPNIVNELIVFTNTELNPNVTVEVSVCWGKQTKIEVSDNNVTVPVITGYEVSLVNTTDSDSVNMAVLLSGSSLELAFTGVPTGRTYEIAVITINGVGKSIRSVTHLHVPGLFYYLTIPNPTSPMSIFTTTVSLTSYHCADSCLTKGLTPSASAGISVAITVPVTAVITAIINVVILYLCQRRVKKQTITKATPTSSMIYDIPLCTEIVEMKDNTAYGRVINETVTNSESDYVQYTG